VARTIAAVIAMSALLGACASDGTPDVPQLKIPRAPYASKVQCEPLTDEEVEVCKTQPPAAKRVCRKVQRNNLICNDRGEWIEDVTGKYGEE
jgi:hypothetical protein